MNSMPPILTTADAATPPPLPFDFPSFVPRAPWWGADLQTVRSVLLRQTFPLEDFPEKRLRFRMPDRSGDVLHGILNQPAESRDLPLIVLVHGLTGCAESHYMRASAAILLRRGFTVMRLNLRGAGPSRPFCVEQYHAGRSEDLLAVLAQLPEHLTGSGVVLVGYSLGANQVLKLLGEGAP
jgi:uncharacterized protein